MPRRQNLHVDASVYRLALILTFHRSRMPWFCAVDVRDAEVIEAASACSGKSQTLYTEGAAF